MQNNFDDLKGTHSCSGKWRVSNVDQYILLKDLIPLLQTKQLQLIDHSDIGWKNMSTPHIKMDERYDLCDVSIPGILAEGVQNPYRKKYRMIDGSHRMAKMTLSSFIRQSYHYVITLEEFYSFLRDENEKVCN
jgi:hypothetical protein